MSKGGSKPAGNTTTTVKNEPWSGSLPQITGALSSAQNLYNQGGPQYYQGNTYAGPNSIEKGAVSNFGNVASGYANGSNPTASFFADLMNGSGAAPGIGTLQDYASGKYLSADNPYFAHMADTLKANILPGINAQFAHAGRGVSGLASRAASEGLGDSIGNLAYQNYQQGLTQQQSAANALTGYGVLGAQSNFNNNRQAQGDALNAGQIQQGWEQDQINADKARWDYNQALPYQNLQNYIQSINALTPGQGQQSTTQPYFQNGTANALGTAAGGLGLLGALGSFGAPAIGAGALTTGAFAAPMVAAGAGSGILGALGALGPALAFL